MAHAFQTRPLYLQVRDAMVERIRCKQWRPGAQLPNEQSLASEFAVSQGTLRKALQVLEQERLIERRQGRGTFVAQIDPEEIAFKFFAIKGLEGLPGAGPAKVTVEAATEWIQSKLDLRASHKVVRIERLRTQNEQPFMIESIYVPERLLPQLDSAAPKVPSFFLIMLFEESGVIPTSAIEKITATNASREEAEQLKVEDREALLRIERIIYDTHGKAIEFRVRICHLGTAFYEAHLP